MINDQNQLFREHVLGYPVHVPILLENLSWMSSCGGFLKWWYPQIIHFNRDFHYKSSIFGFFPPILGNPPCCHVHGFCWIASLSAGSSHVAVASGPKALSSPCPNRKVVGFGNPSSLRNRPEPNDGDCCLG